MANDHSLLPLPMIRKQWTTTTDDDGYSGETSLQTAALYHGAWLSLEAIRDAGRGELLIHDVETEATRQTFRRALEHYGFEYEFCTAEHKEDFVTWLTDVVERRYVVAVGVATPFGDNDHAYDRIVTLVTYDERTDDFVFHDHLTTNQRIRIKRTVLVKRTRDRSLPFVVKQRNYYAVAMGTLPKDWDTKASVTVVNLWQLSPEWKPSTMQPTQGEVLLVAELLLLHLTPHREYVLWRHVGWMQDDEAARATTVKVAEITATSTDLRLMIGKRSS